MTEEEWLAATEPTPMLELLPGMVSDRKWRLIACAYCRTIWQLLADERAKLAVERAEGFCDGFVTADELERASFAAEDASNEAYYRGDGILCNAAGATILAAQCMAWTKGLPALEDGMSNVIVNVIEAAEDAKLRTRGETLTELTKLLRDQIGNPFRPVTIDPAWHTRPVVQLAQAIYRNGPSTACPSWPTRWKTPAAPTRTSWRIAAGRGRTCAAAGSWIC